MNSEWYCEIDGITTGTFSVEELLQMAASGSLAPTDRVRRGEEGTWIQAQRLPGMVFPKTAMSAMPPKPGPRNRSHLSFADPVEDGFIDILTRGFDSPIVRGERLKALTGGAEPIERNRTCKVVCQRKKAEFFTASTTQTNEYLADVVFTDTGLLLTNFAALPKRGESGNQAWLHLGLLGLIIYQIAESWRVSRGKTQAEKTYYQMADQWENEELAAIFKKVPFAEFIPADEITRAKVRSSGVLEFRFRSWKYTARPERKADHPALKMPSNDDFQTWMQEASAARAAQTGGPPNGGPAAISEWSARTSSQEGVPSWVPTAIHRMEEQWGHKPKELHRWIPKNYHPRLFHRLAEVESPAAAAWHHRFGRRLRLPGWICLGIAFLLGLCAAVLALLAVNEDQKPRGEPAPLAIMGIILGITAIFLLMIAMTILIRYRNRAVPPPREYGEVPKFD